MRVIASTNQIQVSPNYPGRTPAETSCEIDLGKKNEMGEPARQKRTMV